MKSIKDKVQKPDLEHIWIQDITQQEAENWLRCVTLDVWLWLESVVKNRITYEINKENS